MTQPASRNAFVALSALAANEQWCWNIFCTTCGHMYFRYALRELAIGKHPDDRAWVVRRSNHHALGHLLGPLQPASRWQLDDQRALVQVLKGVSLVELPQVAAFPDWLGYLGLGLLYTHQQEMMSRELTVALGPQFFDLTKGNPAIQLHFQAILQSQTRVISWQDLEIVESGVRSWRSP